MVEARHVLIFAHIADLQPPMSVVCLKNQENRYILCSVEAQLERAHPAAALVHRRTHLELLVLEQACAYHVTLQQERKLPICLIIAATQPQGEEGPIALKEREAHAFEALINFHGALLAGEDLEARVSLHTSKARVRDDLAAPAPTAPPAMAASHPANTVDALLSTQ